MEQITSRVTSVFIMRHLTCLRKGDEEAPRKYASLCHDKNSLQSISEQIAGRFVRLLDTSMQQVIGRSLLLHCETVELQHSHWRQDVRTDTLTLALTKGSSRRLEGWGKWSQRISRVSCTPPYLHVSLGLKGVHKTS